MREEKEGKTRKEGRFMGEEERIRDKGDLSNKIDELLNKIDVLEKKHEQTNKSLDVIKSFILQEKEKSQIDEGVFFDVSEVAEIIHFSKRTIQKYWREGIIKGEKDVKSGRISFKKADVINHINNSLMSKYGIKGSE